MKLTLVLPLFTAAAQLLFDSANYPMSPLISQIISNVLPVLVARLSVIRFDAAFAVNLKSVLAGTIFVKLTFFFPSLAFGATFLFHAPDSAMAFLIAVVFLCHCLLALRSRPPFLRSCT